MNYGKVEERSSSRSRSPSTARRAATSAILTDILSRSDRAQTSHTVNARPGWSVFLETSWIANVSSLLDPIRNTQLGSLAVRAHTGHTGRLPDRYRPFGV